MTGGSGDRAKDVRYLFPLRHERQALPRFDVPYVGPDGQSIEFAADGTLQWNTESGTWSVHGDTLFISAAARDCEGAIGFSEIYLICAGGEALADRTQLVLTVATDSA